MAQLGLPVVDSCQALKEDFFLKSTLETGCLGMAFRMPSVAVCLCVTPAMGVLMFAMPDVVCESGRKVRMVQLRSDPESLLL